MALTVHHPQLDLALTVHPPQLDLALTVHHSQLELALTVHPPQLDLAVVGAADDERQRGVEGHPVDAAVVALQHVLNDGVRLAEQLGGARAL